MDDKYVWLSRIDSDVRQLQLFALQQEDSCLSMSMLTWNKNFSMFRITSLVPGSRMPAVPVNLEKLNSRSYERS